MSMKGLKKGRHAGPRILVASCCFVLFAAACTSPADTTTSTTATTQPATGTLIVHGGTVELNGLAVPPGTTVDVQAGDRLQAKNGGLATLRQAQLSLELFKGSDLRVPDTTKSPVVIPLESGHVQVSVPSGAAQVQLQTPNRTLTVGGTDFVVCQADGTTCLFVIDGSVDWSDPLGDMTYFAGEGTFATADQGPQTARCDMDNTVEQWLDTALAGQQNPSLTATVGTLPEESCGTETGLPSADGTEQVAIADPVIGTDDFADQPDNYRERGPIDGPIAFYVDERAVSNRDFRSWVVLVAQNDPEEWKRLVPNSWLDDFEGVETQADYPSGEDDLAVVGVRWEAAADYCRDLGKHLVTEIEWELAAVNDHLLDLEAERQDWVAEPGEYGDEPPEGERMMRGNNDTLQLDPYYRLSVVDTVESTATRSGVRIRCAAPEVEGAPPATVVFADDFTSLANEWPGDEDELFALNYHRPATYHLESRQQHTRGAVIRDTSGTLEDVVINAEVFIVRDRMGEVAGNYRFGVTAGSPETGFLLFTVQPNETTRDRHDWCVSMMSDRLTTMLVGVDRAWYQAPLRPESHEGEFCSDGLNSGFIDVEDIDDPLVMTIRVSADDVVVALNGREEGSADIAIPVDAFGFFTQTYAKNKAHIHFDEVSVTVP
jgi:hypothetical protein